MNKEDIANIKIILYGSSEDFQKLYLQKESTEPDYIDKLLKKVHEKVEYLVVEKKLEKMQDFPEVEKILKKIKD
jgi:predicted house-cleaning noncanonical NTP pyrophosphatase (MazG superfamily)